MTRKEREELQVYFDEKFRGVDQGLDGMSQRFDGVDQRLDGMSQRFDGVDQRLDGMSQRFDGVDQQIAGIDQRLAGIDAHLDRQDAALEQTTLNLLLTIDAESAKVRRYAERLFPNVDAPLGSALESPQTRDRPKRHGSAHRRTK